MTEHILVRYLVKIMKEQFEQFERLKERPIRTTIQNCQSRVISSHSCQLNLYMKKSSHHLQNTAVKKV